MAENRQKIKLVKLYELLSQETDEEHPISRMELCKRLNEMDISSNVRTLSKDIDVLNENGYQISSVMIKKEKYYYVSNHNFSVPEIKIMIDALQAASFIPKKMTDELIDKMANLGGSNSKKILKESIICFNTRKHSNDTIFGVIDALTKAITRKKKVKFNYFDLNEKKQKVFRCDEFGNKKEYIVEPLALVYVEDNYYLNGITENHPDKTTNYRVDRIFNIEGDKKASVSDFAKEKIKRMPKYTKEVFKMFAGEEKIITLRFDSDLLGSVYDKFGEDIDIKKISEGELSVCTRLQVSPTFYGWVAQFGKKMRIHAPAAVREDYIKHIRCE